MYITEDNTISFPFAIENHAIRERLQCNEYQSKRDDNCAMILFLHLVHKLVSCNSELLLNNVAHGHQILKTLLKDGVNTDTI